MPSNTEQSKSLTETVVDRLRTSIVSGECRLGEKLSVHRLAARFEVSRSPVHDALTTLQAEGLVNISARRGSFVFTPESDEVEDLCEYRIVLETAAIRMAIDKNPDELALDLGECIAGMQEALREGDSQRYTREDMRFHNAIIERSGNRNIKFAYARALSPVMALRNHLFTVMDEGLDRSFSEHTAILKACEAGDEEAAAKLLEGHVGHLAEAFRVAPARAPEKKPRKRLRRRAGAEHADGRSVR